eukprot:1337623-Ditylum_brightwellii.AAC.1
MQPRTVGAIALHPTGNSQGDGIVDHVHKMAQCDPLGKAIDNRTSTESLHEPPPEQIEMVDEDDSDNSTYHPSHNDNEYNDEANLPSILSIQGISICHELDNFDPTDTTATTAAVPDEVLMHKNTIQTNAPALQDNNTGNMNSTTGVNEDNNEGNKKEDIMAEVQNVDRRTARV